MIGDLSYPAFGGVAVYKMIAPCITGHNECLVARYICFLIKSCVLRRKIIGKMFGEIALVIQIEKSSVCFYPVLLNYL